ncbi:MAG TPA: hypothetical protein VFN95_16325 [Flavitalea sp.]|nr:hypothetical protein [Flavitalea sp.]
MLQHLLSISTTPILIGTWMDAGWAIDFYRKHGFVFWQKPRRIVCSKNIGKFPTDRSKHLSSWQVRI